MSHTPSFRVQYWGRNKTSHSLKQYADYTSALLAYSRNVQDAAIGLVNIERIRLEKSLDEAWLTVYECSLKYTSGETEKRRSPRRDITIKNWRKAHPDGSQNDCIKETGLSPKAVEQWWD